MLFGLAQRGKVVDELKEKLGAKVFSIAIIRTIKLY